MIDRNIHPLAVWIWAMGMVVALARFASLDAAVVLTLCAGLVVHHLAEDSPWRSAFRRALMLAAFVLLIRMLIGITLTVPTPGKVLFSLPQLKLPGWFAGIGIGGPVTVERVMSAVNEGSVIAGVIALIGAAVSLSQPRRLLRLLPGALRETGVAVVIASTFVPQLIASVQRVRDAHHLRGRKMNGLASWRGIAVPVLEDALERATSLAMAMESRGYGRRTLLSRTHVRTTHALMVIALTALLIGSFQLVSAPNTTAGITMLAGVFIAAVALWRAGNESPRTSYREEHWNAMSVLLVITALATAAFGLLSAPSLLLFVSAAPALTPRSSE